MLICKRSIYYQAHSTGNILTAQSRQDYTVNVIMKALTISDPEWQLAGQTSSRNAWLAHLHPENTSFKLVRGYVHTATNTSTSAESRFQIMARTSFTRTSERSWSLVQGQLNTCLPTIFPVKSKCKKVTIFYYIVNNFTNR